MQLDAVGSALDDLAAADPFSYSDPESIIEIQRQLAKYQYIASKAVAAFHESKEWAPDGARTSVAWIDTRCHVRNQKRAASSAGVGLLPTCQLLRRPGWTATSEVPRSTYWQRSAPP